MNIELQSTKHTPYHQKLVAATTAAAARHACSSERPQGCGPPQQRFESVLARYNGQSRGELGEGVLGAGEKGLPIGPATATERHKKGFESEGIALLGVHFSCVLCCFGSLGACLCVAGSSIARRSVPAIGNKTGYLAREFAHSHSQLRMWELILNADNH